MDYKCKIICALSISGEVENGNYTIEEGTELIVESQSIDKKKWFVLVPSIQKYDYIEKYYFDFIINTFTAYPKYYGEFQLPVIGENLHSFVCAAPTGHVVWIHKEDAVTPVSYSSIQRLNCDDIMFR